jgi:hypothetical protein
VNAGSAGLQRSGAAVIATAREDRLLRAAHRALINGNPGLFEERETRCKDTGNGIVPLLTAFQAGHE